MPVMAFGAGRPDEQRVFPVGWELHYGYYLILPGDGGHAFPRFQNPESRAAFDALFQTHDLSDLIGKVVYCRCMGHWIGDLGQLHEFAVIKAELYAEVPPKVR